MWYVGIICSTDDLCIVALCRADIIVGVSGWCRLHLFQEGLPIKLNTFPQNIELMATFLKLFMLVYFVM